MNIKKLRLERGLTQQALANAVYVTRSAVCLWESGARVPETTTLLALADVLECSLDDLVGRTPPEAAS